MASNITSSAVFTTASMKPTADDVGTADWAQKVAENTGYNYYRTKRVCLQGHFNGGGTVFTVLFKKLDGVNTIYVAVRGVNAPTGSTSLEFKFWGDGDNIASATPDLSQTDSFTATANTTTVRSIDISSLTTDAEYIMQTTFTDSDTGFPSVFF